MTEQNKTTKTTATKTQPTWTYFKGLYGWAVFNEKYKYISHYEETRLDAYRTCAQWNREGREF